VGGERVKVNAHADTRFEPGQPIWLKLVTEKIRWMDRNTGRAIL
jgi:urease beta subunit